MAVKGRLRFEILRRDNHQCRYCGATAPDVKLTVDHVVPESLGGSDDPTNLVAACTSCNGGKASIAPDSAVVADVAADATRYAQALRVAQEERARQHEIVSDLIDEFDAAWSAWGRGEGEDRTLVSRANDWRNTLERWFIGGLDVEELIDKIPTAMRKRVKKDDEWRYFCGIGWNMLSELQDRARELAQLSAGDDEIVTPVVGVTGLWRCTECDAHDPPSVCMSCGFDHGAQWMMGRARDQQTEAVKRDELLALGARELHV